MATELEKLKSLLAELFQLDAADDLDFGMYRVLRLRRDELTAFLENTLTSEVKSAMGAVADKEREGVVARMRHIEEQAAQFNASPEGNAEYVKLRRMLAESSDASARERQVYAHLAEFFSRYYEDGDFLSLPRMKADTYAIPYDGSEVVLHWANKDQYYVKSGEYFARYAFQLGDGRRVVFRLVDAQVDPDNMKSADARKRRVILAEDDAVKLENGELVCRFVFAATEGKQDAVNVVTERRVADAAPPEWTAELTAEKPGQTSKEKHSTLGWHLRQYVEKNKRDYFIHKDLGGFLRRELDHYLKTEVFDLDSVETMGDADVGRAVTMVKTVRAVAKPIIAFLSSIEDFQKRLFLKKKMVLRTDWCVTLDRVPEEFYPEIAANKAQVARWKELFAIDAIEVPPMVPGGDGKGETASIEFLKRNRGLVVETAVLRRDHPEVVDRLLMALGSDIEHATSARLVRGENLQVLRLLTEGLGGGVACAFVDPPYNTGGDGFPYKDGYRHSSWASMLLARTAAARLLLADTGAYFVCCDENEQARAVQVVEEVFRPENFIASLVWEGGRKNDAKQVSLSHEYVLAACRSTQEANASGRRWLRRKEGADAIFSKVEQIARKHGSAASNATEELKLWYAGLKTDHPAKQHSRYHWMDERAVDRGPYFADKIAGPDDGRLSRPRQVVLHPITGKPVKMPKTGWCWEDIHEKVREGWVHFGEDETTVPCKKTYLRDTEFEALHSVFYKDGRAATLLLENLLPGSTFRNPKDVEVVGRMVGGATRSGEVAIDFFAGSGTTGHAVLNLNREDNGNRKFILVEVNDYFDTVLLPRILKATYSKDWKDGKPVDRTPVPGGALYKVLYLESYEDTLANITLPPPPSENLLPLNLRRDYTIRYMLDHETRQAVLDLDHFRKPFGWTMEVRRGGLVTKDHPVDLVETFNYLIGLHVSRYGFFRAANRIRYVEGTVKEDGNDRRVLVLWRDCDLVPDEELVRLFDDREFAPVSSREYDRIYVNGDPPLANIKRQDEQWKVLAIEDEFKRLSFADDEA